MPHPDNNAPWWEQYRDIAPHFLHYIEQEDQAVKARIFCMNLFPGIIQAEAYTTNVLNLFYRPELVPSKIIERHVTLRQERQHRAMGRAMPLHILLGEQVLYRKVGGAEVLRQQLLHTEKLARLPHITLQVIPLDCSRPSVVINSHQFTLLTLDSDILYVDDGRQHSLNQAEINQYAMGFAETAQQAYATQESLKLLDTLAAGLLLKG